MSNLSDFTAKIDNAPIGYGRYLNVAGNSATVQYKNATYLRSGILVDPEMFPLAAGINTAGEVWTQRTLPVSASWQSVTYGNGLFVAVASSTSNYVTSTDGINWTSRIGPPNGGNVLCYGNGLFVALTSYYATVYTSPDGITWTLRTPPVTGVWSGIAYGNGMFIAVGSPTTSNTSGLVMKSSNGITWTQCSSVPINAPWTSVCYGNGLFVITCGGAGSSGCIATADGTTFTLSNGYANSGITKVAYGNGIFVGFNNNGQRSISLDGNAWTYISNTLTTPIGIYFGNGLFVVFGSQYLFHTSPDGITWTQRTLSMSSSYSAVCYGNGAFVALATGSAIAASSGVSLGVSEYTPNLYFRVA